MTKNLSVYISRGKVIVSDEGLIDANLSHNVAFIVKRSTATKKQTTKKAIKPKVVKPTKKVVKKPEPKNGVAKKLKVQPEKLDPKIEARLKLEQLKIETSVESAQQALQILIIKKEKMQGLHIPTELAMSVIVLMSESMKTAYIEASERLIIVIGQRKKLTAKDIAEIRKSQTQTINRAIDTGIRESKRGIKRIVTEYSQKRGVGESK